MFDTGGVVFDPSLVGGAESLVVPSAEALNKLRKGNLLFFSCSVLARLVEFPTDLGHILRMVTSADENSGPTAGFDLDVAKKLGGDILSCRCLEDIGHVKVLGIIRWVFPEARTLSSNISGFHHLGDGHDLCLSGRRVNRETG